MANKKARTAVPQEVVAAVLYASDHTCCICMEPGKQIQIHHIDEDPSNNDPSNLAVLCMEDHNRAHLSGGFGRRLSASVINHHHDEWLARVARRRVLADEAVIARMAGVKLSEAKEDIDAANWTSPPSTTLVVYIDHLPDALAAAHAAERQNLDSGVTSQMVQATVRMADAVEQMWLYLSRWYPPGHFGQNAARYISAFRAERAQFHWAIWHVRGERQGTMVRPIVSGGVLRDLERNVELTVAAMRQFDDDNDFNKWFARWQRASGVDHASPSGWRRPAPAQTDKPRSSDSECPQKMERSDCSVRPTSNCRDGRPDEPDRDRRPGEQSRAE